MNTAPPRPSHGSSPPESTPPASTPPASTPAGSSPQGTPPPASPPATPASPPSNPASPRADILVVDNDRDLRRLVAIRLEAAGHRVVMAESGAQALAEWNRRHFDLVISDIRMPNGDGLALAEAVQRARSVPIIFMTGFRDRYEPRLALARDVVVIEKPFDAAALVALVEALLHGRPLGRGGA